MVENTYTLFFIWLALLSEEYFDVSQDPTPQEMARLQMAENRNLWSLAKLWWSNPWIRILVVSTVPLSLIDDAYTWMYVKEFGLVAEINPFTRFFFRIDLGIIWAVLNALVPFICMVLLGSLYESLRGESKSWIATAFSALFTLKMLTAFYHAFYFNFALSLVATLTGFLSFVLVRHVLISEGEVKWEGIRRGLWIKWLGFTSNIAKVNQKDMMSFVRKVIGETSNEFTSGNNWKKLKGSKLLLLLLAFLILPVLTIRLIEFLAELMGIRSLPSWMQGLGMVSQTQGAMFLLAFILTLVIVGVLMYILLSVFSKS